MIDGKRMLSLCQFCAPLCCLTRMLADCRSAVFNDHYGLRFELSTIASVRSLPTADRGERDQLLGANWLPLPKLTAIKQETNCDRFMPGFLPRTRQVHQVKVIRQLHVVIHRELVRMGRRRSASYSFCFMSIQLAMKFSLKTSPRSRKE